MNSSTPTAEPITEPEMTLENLLSGLVNLEQLSLQIELLKNDITSIRYEMTLFAKRFVSFDVSITPQVLFEETSQQVVQLSKRLETYTNAYNRLLPLLQYSRDRLSGPAFLVPVVEAHSLDVLKASSAVTADGTTKAPVRSLGNSISRPIVL